MLELMHAPPLYNRQASGFQIDVFIDSRVVLCLPTELDMLSCGFALW